VSAAPDKRRSFARPAREYAQDGEAGSARVSLRLGVLGLQGAFSEHVDALHRALAKQGVAGTATTVRRPDELAALDGLVMPGGESTTISKLLRAFNLHDLLVTRARDEDFPILGTCAGMILLAKEGDGQVEKTETRLLGLMDMAVNRNAFGRQRESFEAALHLKGFEGEVPGVFIRAPAVTRTWGACEPLGELGGWTIAARQGNRMGIAFHPELTPDTRVHEHFVRTVEAWKRR
jgi:5'-phosphate synthase pdxT subunit